jgi:hypothetical protein
MILMWSTKKEILSENLSIIIFPKKYENDFQTCGVVKYMFKDMKHLYEIVFNRNNQKFISQITRNIWKRMWKIFSICVYGYCEIETRHNLFNLKFLSCMVLMRILKFWNWLKQFKYLSNDPLHELNIKYLLTSGLECVILELIFWDFGPDHRENSIYRVASWNCYQQNTL